jgi:hypothetical protein
MVIVYPGSIDDIHAVIQFLRFESSKLKILRKLVVNREKTVIQDVNGDLMEFPGLSYGAAALEEILRELGVIFTPKVLHNPNATPGGVKEFRLGAKWTWGHDRVM